MRLAEQNENSRRPISDVALELRLRAFFNTIMTNFCVGVKRRVKEIGFFALFVFPFLSFKL